MNTLRDFIRKHSDVSWSLLKASHISCQGIDEDDMFLIYEHTEKCPWCKNYIRSREDMKERLKPSSADKEMEIQQINKIREIMFSNPQPVT